VNRECEKLQSELDRLKSEKPANTERRQAITNDLTKINQEICKQVVFVLVAVDEFVTFGRRKPPAGTFDSIIEADVYLYSVHLILCRV